MPTIKNLTETRISWIAVANAVSEVAGKPYSANYVREVASGYRTNHQLTIVLQNLGIVKKEVA